MGNFIAVLSVGLLRASSISLVALGFVLIFKASGVFRRRSSMVSAGAVLAGAPLISWSHTTCHSLSAGVGALLFRLGL